MDKSFKCNLCDKKYSYKSSLNCHILSVHEGLHPVRVEKREHKCNVCGYNARQTNELINHMRKHTGERPFKCTLKGCEKTFKAAGALKLHIEVTHNDERPFKCDFLDCKYAAKKYKSLIQHEKVHSDDRPFACPKAGCNYRTKLSQYITVHVASVHSEARPFVCSKCDFKTTTSGLLKTHILFRHSTQRDFKCSYPQCGASFKTSSSRSCHFSYRHAERNVPCDHPGCDRKFTNRQAVYQHKQFAHSNKRLACPILNCSYCTHYSGYLARHMKDVHEGGNEKLPCLLEGCEYKGKHIRALKKHMRRHKTRLACPVSGCARYASSKKALRDHVKYHDPSGRPFQCPLCYKYYARLNQLQRLCFTHTTERPFGCGHCEFSACVLPKVETHISLVHANINFPFVSCPLDSRKCLHCKVTLPLTEFLVHSMGHFVPVVMLESLKIKWS